MIEVMANGFLRTGLVVPLTRFALVFVTLIDAMHAVYHHLSHASYLAERLYNLDNGRNLPFHARETPKATLDRCQARRASA